MKIALFGALALGLSCSLAAAQPARAPVKSEAQLLFEKCGAAYSELKSYRGTTKTTSLSLTDGSPSISSGFAKISFTKPDLLRVDGKLTGTMGGDYSILGNADGSWLRWPRANKGDWAKVPALRDAVASMTGVGGGAPTTIPFLLTQTRNARVFGSAEEAKVEPEEPINGEICYKITARTGRETISWWINKKTLLLRRIVGYTSEEQSAAQMVEIEKMAAEAAKKAGVVAPKLNLRFVSRTEDFEIEAINEPVDEKLFETPTPK